MEKHLSDILNTFISSDRSSYSDSVLVEIRANFLRFWAFLPIYIVFLFEILTQIAAIAAIATIAAIAVSFCGSLPPEFLRSFLHLVLNRCKLASKSSDAHMMNESSAR